MRHGRLLSFLEIPITPIPVRVVSHYDKTKFSYVKFENSPRFLDKTNFSLVKFKNSPSFLDINFVDIKNNLDFIPKELVIFGFYAGKILLKDANCCKQASNKSVK